MSTSRTTESTGRELLAERIRACDSLPPVERRVADFYLGSWPGVAFLNLAAVSQACDCSTATVTRFARHIGFEDFRDLSGWLKGQAREELELPADRRGARTSAPEGPLESSFRRAQHDLARSLHSVDAAAFARAAELVARAERPLYLAAVASGRPLVEHAAMLLAYLRGQVTVLEGVDRWPHQLAGLDERGVVLVAAYDRDPVPVTQLLQLARTRGATSILVTNRPASPLLQLADVPLVLDTERGAMFGSRVATLALLEALVDSLARDASVGTERSAAIEEAFVALDVQHPHRR